MSFLTGAGGFLGGINDEAAKVRKERYDNESKNLNLATDMLKHIIDNPNIADPNIKAQAQQAYRDIVMEHMFPDQFKKDKKNPVSKLVEQFIGQQDNSKAIGQRMQQFGVGTGNAKSMVGAPQPTAGGGGPPPPPPGMDTQAPGGPVPQAQPQAPPVGMPPDPDQAGLLGPPQMVDGFVNPIEAKLYEEQQTEVTKGAAERIKVRKQIKDREDMLVEAGWSRKDAALFAQGHNPMTSSMTAIPGVSLGSDIKNKVPLDMVGEPIEDDTTYKIYKNAEGEIVGAMPEAPKIAGYAGDWVQDPESPSGWTHLRYNQQGAIVSQTKGVVPPPGYLPKTSTAFKLVPQKDGTIEAQPFTSTSGPVLPGGVSQTKGATSKGAPMPPPPMATPPAPKGQGGAAASPKTVAGSTATQGGPKPTGRGVTVGSKSAAPLSEAQVEKMDAQNQSLDATLDIMTELQTVLPGINGFIDKTKINIAADPQSFLSQLAANNIKLTDQEAHAGVLLNSASEHINTIRGPLGATGFRGSEAFGALQAQRGNLMANSAIASGVLGRTIRVVLKQQSTIAKSLAVHYGTDVKIPPKVFAAYKQIANGDVKLANKWMDEDGWPED